MLYGENKIIRECPVCGETAIFNKDRLPEDPKNPVYIKTKRGSVILVHRSCYEQTKYNYTKEE